jgi:3-phenylpropionate/trans-cinnamate dioxygenase ferredoxin reductase subunit
MAGVPESKCVIVGASHAGAQTAMRLRRIGWEGSITLIGDEPRLPYHRPPLSKDYLKGAKSIGNIQLNPEAAYQKSTIELLLGKRITSIDRGGRKVALSSGDSLDYDKLVLATGSNPRALPVPGADLEGVFYLRDADDVDGIRRAIKESRKAVVIGGGYIGLEAAASLRSLGLDVVVVEAMERVLQRVTCETVSDFFTRVHREEGVDIRVNTAVTAICGDKSVSGIETAEGDFIDADLVIIGIGIIPNVEASPGIGAERERPGNRRRKVHLRPTRALRYSSVVLVRSIRREVADRGSCRRCR